MSQAKVDKYKEQKKNRAKTMKLNKIKKALVIFVVALGIGALIGIPLGKYIYKQQKEAAARNATISSLEFEDWFNKKWAGEYSDMFVSASETDAEEDEEDEEDDEDAEEIELDEGEDLELDDGEIVLDEDDVEE